MTDSMKFGPEWLRNLSETGPQTARYQLAEYRYGREEMLALFSHSLSPPESLKNIPCLFVEKCQPPLALSGVSDEEARTWNRGVNPDMGGAGGGGRGGAKGTGDGRGRREGRGGRGGRGGLTGGTFYGRSPNPFDPDGNGLDTGGQLFSRTRTPFQTERISWSERNGECPSGRGRGADSNWRRGVVYRVEDDGPPIEWRSSKWIGSIGSSSRPNWREEEWIAQQLPEWALEKGDSVQGGSFDASGAFHDHPEEEPPVREPPMPVKGKKSDNKEKDVLGGGSEKEDERPTEPASPAQAQQSPAAGGLEEIKKQLAALEKDEVPPSEIEEIRKQLERLESKRRQKAADEEKSQQAQQSLQQAQQLPPASNSQQQVQQPSQQPPPAVEPTPPMPAPPQILQTGTSHLSALNRLHQEPPPPMQEENDMNIATDLVSKLMDDAEKQDKQWYYRDPQGEVQGPFTAGEMAEWFSSGYFTLNLMVRRGCDPTMMPLGELIKIWGCIPFLVDGSDGDHAFKTEAHYRQMAARQRAALGKLPNQWPPEHNQVVAGQMGEGSYPVPAAAAQQQASNQLRALLAQMQQKQRDAMASTGPTSPVMPPQPPPPAKEVVHTPGGSGNAVMETLLSLHREQVAQQAALQAALHQHQMEHHQAAGASLHSLLRQMQHKQQMAAHMPQQPPQPGVDSVWNGVANNQWSQWAQPPTQQPKGIKTEQQVIEEQMRAEDDRKREEHLRKADDGDSKEEELRLDDRQPRPDHPADCPRPDDDAIRRKHEAARRAEVERQRKEEDKRKREEEKRRKEEEKRKLDERERLKLGEERKKKEAEEKATADLMSRIQRAQWCPPAASNTSLVDIQRAQAAAREQLARAAAAEAAQAQQQAQEKGGGMHLGWTEPRQTTTAESLAEIQQQQYRQFLIKQMQEKEKAEREKKEVNSAATWGTQGGLTWGSRPASVWGGAGGFWDAKPQQQQPPPQQQQPTPPQQPPPQMQQQQPPPQQKKEQKQPTSKAKRDELAVLHMFNPAATQGQDEFTSWCQAALQSFTMQLPVDIPTFVTFLRDVEKAEEVVDYVRNYVGETKESLAFAREFLERRRTGGGGGGIVSALHHQHDEFQQVKGKGKSKKKGKGLQKVDPRILGFSTNAAPVGEREFVDDV